MKPFLVSSISQSRAIFNGLTRARISDSQESGETLVSREGVE